MCVEKGANSIEKPRECTVNSWCRFLHHLNAGKKKYATKSTAQASQMEISSCREMPGRTVPKGGVCTRMKDETPHMSRRPPSVGGVTCRARLWPMGQRLISLWRAWCGMHACLKRSAWDQEIAYFPARHDEMGSRKEGTQTTLRSSKVERVSATSGHMTKIGNPVGAVHPYKHCQVWSVLPHIFFFCISSARFYCALLLSPDPKKEKKNKTKQK